MVHMKKITHRAKPLWVTIIVGRLATSYATLEWKVIGVLSRHNGWCWL